MLPVEHNDPINEKILAISEDKIEGFVREPFRGNRGARGVAVDVVMARIAAMLRAGTIRRVRQTLLATNLADGALVAWKVPEEKIDAAFDFMFQCDPFSGHVVLRSTDTLTAGSDYKLWTTVKVPHGFSLRRTLPIARRQDRRGTFSDHAGERNFHSWSWPCATQNNRARKPGRITGEDDRSARGRIERARVEGFAGAETGIRAGRNSSVAVGRARERSRRFAGRILSRRGRANARKIIGRFSTFLEHVKPSAGGVRVTRFNALFHWAVPPGREVEAGGEIGRHHILTHCYWREGGPEFRNVNIMAVAHGTDKARLLEHKAAIDAHLAAKNVPVSYTNVFWGGRSEIKPSEISPMLYRKWLSEMTPQAA